ncbi:hypothetical protein ACFZDG_16430 [Kitasatospora xanthocidica]|uniref:hypothetical protein n=1 Tax=Kitasatospora xanthocidica TaxID=83382 RepID=UPI0036F15740
MTDGCGEEIRRGRGAYGGRRGPVQRPPALPAWAAQLLAPGAPGAPGALLCDLAEGALLCNGLDGLGATGPDTPFAAATALATVKWLLLLPAGVAAVGVLTVTAARAVRGLLPSRPGGSGATDDGTTETTTENTTEGTTAEGATDWRHHERPPAPPPPALGLPSSSAPPALRLPSNCCRPAEGPA